MNDMTNNHHDTKSTRSKSTHTTRLIATMIPKVHGQNLDEQQDSITSFNLGDIRWLIGKC